MGTNYYFMTKSKRIAHKHFAIENSWGVSDEEYRIVDEPFLGYEIHLNKLSMGWRPLFQEHKEFRTWNELEQFYQKHKKYLSIYDEYGDQFTWDEYKEKIFNHTKRDPKPCKWVYGIDPIDKVFQRTNARERIHLEECDPEEAEIWTPFDHVKYFESEKKAKERFGVYDYPVFQDLNYWNDDNPEYMIDWTEGDFS